MNLFADFKLVVMVAEFLWNALTNYAGTPEGTAALQAIEAELQVVEGNAPSSSNQQTSGVSARVAAAQAAASRNA